MVAAHISLSSVGSLATGYGVTVAVALLAVLVLGS
jgi:hypothetical protein